jgi:short-subunit dehydrogenase
MTVRLSDIHGSAFLTGASTGLGRAFAEMLLAEGVRVWGTSRDISRLAALRDGNGSRFMPVTLDLGDTAAAVAAFLEASTQAGGGFDLVINNAGFGVFGEFDKAPAGVWRAQIDAMLGTTLGLTHAAYGAMRARGRGCLVNVSSLAAEFPIPFMSGYNVAKAGLSALSESLLFECRGSAVNVIDFRPGDYLTPFNKSMQRRLPIDVTSRRGEKAWRILESNLLAAPQPSRAAADLRLALLRRRGGVVRSGSFFQARLAPLLARLAPAQFVRAGTARYFGSA